MMMNEALVTLANEPTLIKRAKGDPASFELIYDFYFSRVYNYVRYRVLDSETADDLTSEIFAAVLNKLHSYNPEQAPFGAWLFGIARNSVNYYLRKEKIRRFFSLEQFQHLASKDLSPGETAVKNETQRELLAAVSQLSARDRELIALKFTAGFTNRTISSMTGLNESHVAVILHRAVKRIRALMDIQEVKQ